MALDTFTVRSTLTLTFPPSFPISCELCVVRGMAGMSSKHLSMVRISDKEFFYTSRATALKTEGDTYNKFSLFAIKYVRDGPLSDDVQALRKVNPSHCFELITEDRCGLLS